jgi:hypothetical protein
MSYRCQVIVPISYPVVRCPLPDDHPLLCFRHISVCYRDTSPVAISGTSDQIVDGS